MTDLHPSPGARPAGEPRTSGGSRPPVDLLHRERSGAARRADHAAIDVLARELVPALIAKLAATGLGELEVREGAWRVRLRLPDGAARRRSRTDGRSGEPAAAVLSARRGTGRDGSDATAGRSSHVLPRSSGGRPVGGTAEEADPARIAATSPAVGYYSPRTGLTAGNRVAAGDRIGAVEVLGIRQEVVAPADGILGASLAEAGQAVEYGQGLVWIEFADASEDATGEVARNLPTEEGAGSASDETGRAAG